VSWWGNRRGRDHWGDLGVYGWKKLGWIYGKRWVYRVLFGKPEGKSPLERPTRRWVDNIRIYLWEEGGYRVLVGKPEGKRPLGRPTRRWVDNIRIYLWEEKGV